MESLTVSRNVRSYSISMMGNADKFLEIVRQVDALAEKLNTAVISNEQEPAPTLNQEPPSVAGAATAPEAVEKLFAANWGLQPRTIREIKEVLAANAVFYPVTTLSGVLVGLAKQGKLRRWKTPQGYVYVRGKMAQ